MSLKRIPALRGLTLLALTMLGGCAVGPDYFAPTIEVPAHWAGEPARGAKRPNLAAWWTRFNDPIMTRLIEEAVDGNLDVAAARGRIREARANRDETAASLLPEVDASTSANRSRQAASAGLPATTSNLFQSGFDASWELDLFGANYRNVEAATYGVEAADEDLRSTLLTLVSDVARYYVDARGYQARVALAQQNAASQQQTVTLTERQFAAGSSTGADVAKAKALALTTAANVPALEISYQQCVHRLGILLGLDPDAVTGRLVKPRPLPLPRASVAVGIPADVVRSRPDVRKAERQLAQATAKIGVAEADIYPSVTLSGSLGVSAASLGNLAKASAGTWSFGPSASIPLFDAGRRRAAVLVQDAQRDQYFVAYKAAVLSAMEGVSNALVSLTQQGIQADRLARAADGYREASRIAHALYQQGSTTFLDVLDAERSLYTAEDSDQQSRIALAEDYVALFKALGGGWDGVINVSRPAVIDRNTGPHARPGRPTDLTQLSD